MVLKVPTSASTTVLSIYLSVYLLLLFSYHHLLIDFDYPYWHTIEDTVDKVSADSLQKVGDVMMQWIMQP